MRTDIQIHINTGDMFLESQNTYATNSFQWVTNTSGLERYVYGEISIPSTVSTDSIKENGVYITIPYTPKYKEMMLRVKRTYGTSDFAYITNPVNGSDWFEVKQIKGDGSLRFPKASELTTISEDDFYIQFDGEYANIYDAKSLDVNVGPVKSQNNNLLLKCAPTNNYRYPLSGVGIVRWINSAINFDKLASTIKDEFEEDGVIVINATYDHETKKLDLETIET